LFYLEHLQNVVYLQSEFSGICHYSKPKTTVGGIILFVFGYYCRFSHYAYVYIEAMPKKPSINV